MKCELWLAGDGYSFFPEDSQSARSLLTPEAELIWTVEACNWEEACDRRNRYLGWEPYIPQDKE